MASKQNPLVSVIVRTKDRPGLLRTALKSIAAQDYSPIEVILINDGGCDLDIKTVTTILGNCSLNYIRSEKNRGRSAAGNAGIFSARGNYIGFLDDDDELCPDHLSTLVVFLMESQHLVAYADSELVLKEVDEAVGKTAVKERKVFSSYEFSYTDLLIANYIPLISLLFSSEVIKQSGGFDEKLNLYEDWDLLLRIGENVPFRHIRKVTSIYNQWNLSSQIAQSSDPDLINSAFLQVLRKHFHKITPEIILSLNDKQKVLTKEFKDFIKKYTSMEDELRRRYAELRQRDDELQQKDLQLHQKNIELSQTALQLSEKGQEAERLIHENMLIRNAIHEMQATFGWQWLERIRAVRDKLLPRETTREKIYQKIVNRLKGAGSDN